MDKYQYAIEEELKWLDEDIRITRACIDGTEFTQWTMNDLRQRLRDSEDERLRLHNVMAEYSEEHEN